MITTHWSRDAVALLDRGSIPSAPVIPHRAVRPLLAGTDLWDMWPVQSLDGDIARIADGSLWMLLSAPSLTDPEDRHAVARIRAMHRTSRGWHDLGLLLPDGWTPGSREWAGSTVFDQNSGGLTLYFTAAGMRGEDPTTFAQRLFETRCILSEHDGMPVFGAWSLPVESVVNDGMIYTLDLEGGGQVGTIKAFRDPAYFRDPADGQEYLLFTASLAASSSDFNGAIGVARRVNGTWRIQPPIIDADGLNNELERPHIVMHAGLYYCFWSTQTKVFAPDGPLGPNGLYGMVAYRLSGPWRPLNGSGLVMANPPSAPFQNYSWLVCADLAVVSFLDVVGLDRYPQTPEEARRHFGGTPAPELHIALDGDRSWLV